MKRFLAAFFLFTTLFLPTPSYSAVKFGFTIVDKAHSDKHVWTRSEDRTYRRYLVSQNHRYVPIRKAPEKDRNDYFAYRHGGK